MNPVDRPDPIEVLLVEDDPGDVLLIREAFEDNKVANRLHVVSDGVEALDFMRQNGEHAEAPRPDLVLLDLNLPRKDGREVLAEVKNATSCAASRWWSSPPPRRRRTSCAPTTCTRTRT
jgi:CheY-like chemotaxis protein